MQIQVLILVLLSSITGWSQSTTGAVVGNITDPTAAGVPQAKVVATEQRTNLTAETVTDAKGAYAFPALRPGVYRIEAESPGFRKAVQSGVEVRVNDRLQINIGMVLGAVSESVEVTGATPLVESQSGAVGNVIENRKITDLPLNARNPFQLALLSPGVVPSPAFGNAFNTSAAFIINGNRANVSEMLIDGVTNSVPAANPIVVVSLFPSPDALEEFKVQTNGYAAEFGRSGGGIINMVLKSGTNQFHGVIYEFLRNSRMDANDFFANRAGRSIPSFKRNQFGGTLGGPIKRDKAFFFVNYEGLRQRTRAQQTGTTPTAAERSGDFSQSFQLVAGRCTPVQIFDPLTTRANPAGGFIRDLIPGNIVPATRMDRVGSKIATFFPNPNAAGAACTGINNFLSDKVAASNTNEVDAKLDWAPTEKNKVTFGMGYRTRLDLAPNHYGNIAATSILPGDSMPAKSARLEYNRTHSPTLLFQARFGVTRLERHQDSNVGPEFSLTELGFPAGLDQQMVRPLGFPVFNFNGFVGMGRGSQFLDQRGTSFMWVGNATKIAGRHQVKVGIEYRVNQSMEGVGNDTSGTFTFDRTYTQGPNPTAPSVDRGNSIASLLLGTATSGGAGVLPYVFTSNPYMALYVQDDYRVTKKLTLNLGLRWDVEKGRNERFNQLSFFDFDTASPLAAATALPNLRGGLRFVGVDGNPRRQFDTDRNNLAPRFALAYSLNEQTIIRGSYGIFYMPYIGAAAGWSSGINGFLSSTAMTASTDGLRPTDLLSNPFPRGLQQPTAPASGLNTNLGQDFGASGRDGAIDRSARVGYSQQWNLNVQRQLPGKLALEAAYVGNKGTKLTDGPLGPQLNQLTSQHLAMGNALLQTAVNPFQPYVRTGPLSQARVTQAQLLRPFPQFLSLYNFRPAMGSSIYHGFQARVEKRYSSGLTLLTALTTGKLIEDTSQTVGFLGSAPTHQDVYNRRASRSLASQDVSRRLVFSYVYDLPFGRGKALASALPRAIDAVIGHWQMNGILTLSTGVPLAIATAQNNSQSFSATQFPNVNGQSAKLHGGSTNDRLARWFDTSVFSQPAPFTFGTGPRVLPDVRADGIRGMDFSLFKDIPIREAMRVQFRAELFNVTNTPNFAPPGQAFGNAAFGVINAQFNTPRQLQLALKFYY